MQTTVNNPAVSELTVIKYLYDTFMLNCVPSGPLNTLLRNIRP